MLSTNWIKKFTLVFEITLFSFGFYFLPIQQTVVQASSPTQQIFKKTTPFGKGTSSVLGIFEGITPCTNVNSPVPQISAATPCELMIWHIVLNQDPKTGQPTTYSLQSAYGMTQPNTTGIAGGGTKLDLEGRWSIIHGTKNNPDALVYQLNSEPFQAAIYFMKIEDNLLHLLTQERTLMVGNGGWSYTLNRTDDRETADPTTPTHDAVIENILLPVESNALPTLGVFEGRTPCADIIYHFTKTPLDPACTKVKWRLTLNLDPETGQPSTYMLKGVHVASEPTIAEIEGTWAAIRAANVYPRTIIYRLNLDASEYPMFFMKVDDHHLFMLDLNLNYMVGDALWSYTLSKVR